MRLIVFVMVALSAAPGIGQADPQSNTAAVGKEGAACAHLRWEDFSSTEDAPTSITDSQVVRDGTLAYCQVDGVVSGKTRFTARFPLADWNGKMVVVGTGGQAGTIMDESKYVRMGGQAGLVAKGYAFLAHDAGHVGARTGIDTLWGINNKEAMIDYGFRGGHLTAVIGKEVLRRFYGRSASRTYYHSCSNGGREGMMMAQRYPWDYDGIIAGAPSMAYGDQVAGLFWLSEQLKDQSRSRMDAIAAKVLHKSVLAQCDKLDGTADGILDDPRRCNIDYRRVQCANGPADDCLTEHQIDIARRIYDGPRRSDGSQIAHSTVMPGSELNWDWSQLWYLDRYASDMLRDLAFDPAPGPGWKADPAKLGDYVKRMGLMDSLFSATSPDMRTFKNRGGKLLIYFGWTDVVGGLRTPMEYYENVERMMGGEKKTQDFFRLFMMPGMDHCTGGEGAYVFDYLGELDKWVETGKGPDELKGYHPNPDGSPQFFRSVKPYRSAGDGRGTR